jgi:putative transposase
VLRIMREESLLCYLKKRFVIMMTNSRHGLPVYPNRLNELVLSAPDQAWVADVTYIRLPSRVCLPGLHSGCLLPSLCRLASLA